MKRVLNEQRDLLKPEAIEAIEKSREDARSAIRQGASKSELQAQMKNLEETARRWFKPYPNPGIRENVKEFLVAVVVILSFTTFFLQLTKIPTGSMQPTLYGIVQTNLRDNPEVKVPGFLGRMALYWTKGISYKHLVAPVDGRIEAIMPVKLVLPFVKKQVIRFEGRNMTVWFPPDNGVEEAGQLEQGQAFKKGDDILKLKVVAGDHLLVDRFTYNFRKPKRGEIFVFKTRGILGIPHQDQLYIKRLVALPNEKVQISNDQHLIINGRKLTASDRHFEWVYTMDGTPADFPYVGHVNGVTGERKYGRRGLAPYFYDESATHVVGPHHYLAMGDNTLNSLDSRAWGDVPEQNIIGKCWFVYWPFTDRFGWSYR